MNLAASLLLLLLSAATLLLCNAQYSIQGANHPPVVSATCDPRGMIPEGSSLWSHLGVLLHQLVDNTPYTPTRSFKTSVGGSDAPAFGEAYCNVSSSPPPRCHACLRRLSYDIWRICSSALGARVAYPDCWIHYEDHAF